MMKIPRGDSLTRGAMLERKKETWMKQIGALCAKKKASAVYGGKKIRVQHRSSRYSGENKLSPVSFVNWLQFISRPRKIAREFASLLSGWSEIGHRH